MRHRPTTGSERFTKLTAGDRRRPPGDGTVLAVFRRFAAPLAAVLLLAACGGGDPADADADTGVAADTPTVTPSTVTASAGDATTAGAAGPIAALQFSAPLVGGGRIDLAELGDRPVLLWFWAPW